MKTAIIILFALIMCGCGKSNECQHPYWRINYVIVEDSDEIFKKNWLGQYVTERTCMSCGLKR